MKTPEQLRNDQRTIQQNYQQDLRNQQRPVSGTPAPINANRTTTVATTTAGRQPWLRQPRLRQPRLRQPRHQRGSNRGTTTTGVTTTSATTTARYGYRDGGYRGHGRGVGPSHSWYRGDRMPYAVPHPPLRRRRLARPPSATRRRSGYHWVQSGGDYLLVGSRDRHHRVDPAEPVRHARGRRAGRVSAIHAKVTRPWRPSP